MSNDNYKRHEYGLVGEISVCKVLPLPEATAKKRGRGCSGLGERERGKTFKADVSGGGAADGKASTVGSNGRAARTLGSQSTDDADATIAYLKM